MKKALIRGLVIALVLVGIAFIGGAADVILTFFVPPRIYYVLAAVIIIILLKILSELRKRNDKED